MSEKFGSSIFHYPNARRDVSVIDSCHGVSIDDPYRWMEDFESEEVKAFVAAQQGISIPYLKASPFRHEIQQRLEYFRGITCHSCPRKHGGKYYYFRNTGNANFPVLYSKTTLDPAAEEKVFLDMNAFSPDGSIAMTMHKFSSDNTLLAYSVSQYGSDWLKIRIKKVSTGEDYPDILEKVKLTCISWTKDNLGFFYSCYRDEKGRCDASNTMSNVNMKLCYHVVGTPQSDDKLVVEFPENPYWRIFGRVTISEQLLIFVSENCGRKQLVYYGDLKWMKSSSSGRTMKLTPLISKFEAKYEFVEEAIGGFYFRTTKNAPNARLVKILLKSPKEESWETIVPEDKKRYLNWTEFAGKNLILLCYIENLRHSLEIRSLEGHGPVQKIRMPYGQIHEYCCTWATRELLFSFSSFFIPNRVYKVDLSKRRPTPRILYDCPLKFIDVSKFTVSQVMYPSKDGTLVPMSILHKQNLARNGMSPCLMYGYGGFCHYFGPSFSAYRFLLMDFFNGVIALPNIRGGCEFGINWYNGGREQTKQNSFDDFQAAAEFLIRAKYTSPKKLAIFGHSNGGLLVGACVNQRPDLFGAAIAAAGILDVVRFHKFTLGQGWTSEYGNPEVPEDFYTLLKYSPLHNVNVPGDPHVQYPALLVTTSDHDDRVVPSHSLKFIAEIQHVLGNTERQKNPLLLLVDENTGHSHGLTVPKQIEESVNILCFLANSLNLTFKENS